jgi:hypothetical protein
MNTKQQESFKEFAIVELFGHQKIAGLVTEAVIGGCSLIRVDVPAIGDQPAYTRYFGQGAIYSLTPVSEEIARSALDYIRPRPVQPYMLPASHTERTINDDQPGIDYGDDYEDEDDEDDSPF